MCFLFVQGIGQLIGSLLGFDPLQRQSFRQKCIFFVVQQALKPSVFKFHDCTAWCGQTLDSFVVGGLDCSFKNAFVINVWAPTNEFVSPGRFLGFGQFVQPFFTDDCLFISFGLERIGLSHA